MRACLTACVTVSTDKPSHEAELLAIDTGGTMTDTFVVDQEGGYTVGKAQSTPENESEGVMDSFADALTHWGTGLDQGAETLRGTVYSGTAMLNRLLEREGDENIGVITNLGFEDTHRFGRGIQSWVDKTFAGRLHAREHEHPEPIVPRENVEGVGGRLYATGDDLIPLHEDDVRRAVNNLLDRDVHTICVSLLFSYLDPSQEQRVKEIAEEVKAERDDDTPIWLSSEQNPVRGELPRLNSLILESYAVRPSRDQITDIRSELHGRGADSPVRVMTSAGGTISPCIAEYRVRRPNQKSSSSATRS